MKKDWYKDYGQDYVVGALLIFAFLLFIGSLVEIGFAVTAYIYADEVHCNWYSCTFVQERMQTNSYCEVNHVQVNCSDFQDEFRDYGHFCSDGQCSMNGVCPGWKENKTVEDCIREASLR